MSRPLGQARPSRGGAGAGGRGPSRDSSITCNKSFFEPFFSHGTSNGFTWVNLDSEYGTDGGLATGVP